jgi:O-antigen/teichoic acid export membrane protein
MRPRFRLALGRVGAQIRLGLVFTINGFLYLLTKSVDRILILLLLGTSALGYYGVALLAMSYVELVGTAVGRVVFPHIVGRFEQRRDLADIRHYVVRASVALGAAGAFCGGLGALLLPAAVTIVLPRYAATSVVPAQILVLAGAYLVIRSTVEYFFVAVSKLPRTFPIQLAVTALALTAGLVVLRADLGLVGMAATMVGAHLTTSLGFTGYAFAHYDHGAGRLAGFLVRVHAPSLYAGGVVLVLERVLPISNMPSPHGAALLAAQLVIFAAAFAPWLISVDGGRSLLPVRLPL